MHAPVHFNKNCIAVGEYCAPKIVLGPEKFSRVSRNGLGTMRNLETRKIFRQRETNRHLGKERLKKGPKNGEKKTHTLAWFEPGEFRFVAERLIGCATQKNYTLYKQNQHLKSFVIHADFHLHRFIDSILCSTKQRT